MKRIGALKWPLAAHWKLGSSLLNKVARALLVPKCLSAWVPECPNAQITWVTNYSSALWVSECHECPWALGVPLECPWSAPVLLDRLWSVLRVIRCPFSVPQVPFVSPSVLWFLFKLKRSATLLGIDSLIVLSKFLKSLQNKFFS